MDSSADRERANEPDKTLVEPLLPSSPVTAETASVEEPRRNLFVRLWNRRGRIRLEEPAFDFENLKKSRVKKILLILLVITILLVLCVVVPVVVVTKRHRARSRMSHPIYFNPAERCINRSVWTPYDGVVDHPHRPHLRYSASTSFTFNRSSDELYFISGGGNGWSYEDHTRGAITFTNDPNVPIDKVEVEVIALYNSINGLRRVDACTLRVPYQNKHGVGIFTPSFSYMPAQDRKYFSINVKLPLPKDEQAGKPLYYGAIRTKLPKFAHRFEDLEGTAEFDAVNIEGINTPFSVGTLVADSINIRSMGASIEGTFNVSDSINLNAFGSGGYIKATVNMESDGISQSQASLHSFDSPVYANFSLISSADDRAKGSFMVNVRNMNAPTKIAIPTAPVGHTLHLNANGHNSPISLQLPVTFEGSFGLTSSPQFPPSVKYDPDVPDPLGMGRHRTVEYRKNSPGSVGGTVSWTLNRVRSPSAVFASTTESTISLTL